MAFNLAEDFITFVGDSLIQVDGIYCQLLWLYPSLKYESIKDEKNTGIKNEIKELKRNSLDEQQKQSFE